MEEELVSFQVAKLAKEKEFNIGCDHYFTLSLTEKIHKTDGTSGPFGWKGGELHTEVGYFINDHSKIDYSNSNWFMCARPSQSLLQKWLREVHGIIVEITWQMCSTDYEYAIIDMNNPPKYEDDIERIIGFKTYEETLEEGLYEGLKLIKGLK